jgi:hypothetical protein
VASSTGVSRRAPRYRLNIVATAVPLLGGPLAVCRTRDVSDVGVCLETAAWFPLGTRLSLSMIDPVSGGALEVIGDVVREAVAPAWTLGILVIEPPAEWKALVTGAAAPAAGAGDSPPRRLRILVIGDAQRQRGAMALYVTSGWDVLFASDDESIAEAVENIDLDAVIAELDADDPRLVQIMGGVRRVQPSTRRIVRGDGSRHHELVHRFVDREAGLAALIDAVSGGLPVS